ncbi:hypothetical protein [Glutamicibacter sp. JC586]|uniref:hypothetical protein n=1 Tax=Glutamicibacter sp. JC586 TaxID=2590552 RepID=UPI00135797FC|nr:hypothetical protein [Glutamicibacter sp. JC586]
MNKLRILSLVTVVASMALVGCSEGSQQSQTSDSSQSSDSVQSPSENLTNQQNLSAEQVKSVASKLLSSDQSVQVIGNEQMQPQLKAAKDATAPSGIKPEKCADLNAKYSVTDLTGTVAATATSSSEQMGKVVQIFSVTDAATKKNISNALAFDDLADCDKVTIEQDGENLTAQRQILPMNVKAEQALTMSTILDAGGGQKLSSIAVQAMDGNNFVLVTLQTGSMQPAELATEAVELTDQAFDEIKSVQ